MCRASNCHNQSNNHDASQCTSQKKAQAASNYDATEFEDCTDETGEAVPGM
ncbi:MAG: hypothetical protein FWG87_06015 [Defluviitaleaceae bacterium]|nr:hypothetical protein [Defluviitaleaceae bacterium]